MKMIKAIAANVPTIHQITLGIINLLSRRDGETRTHILLIRLLRKALPKDQY